MEHLKKFIGQKVEKFPSNKPFKSGLKINTVKDIIIHDITGYPAFTFLEDDSYLEIQKCIPINLKIDFKEVYRLYPDYRIITVVEFYIPGKGWTKEFSIRNLSLQNNRNVKDQIMFCYMDGATNVMLQIKNEDEIKEPDYKINELVTFPNVIS